MKQMENLHKKLDSSNTGEKPGDRQRSSVR